MAGSRSTLRHVAKTIAEMKSAAPTSVEVSAVIAGKASDPSWQVTVSATNANDNLSFILSDDSGKVRRFTTLDAAVKAIAKVSEDPNGTYIINNVETAAAFASKVPANIYAAAESEKAKLVKVKAAQQIKVNALNALIGEGGAMDGWDSGNAAQQARYSETSEQINAIEDDVAALAAEIDRLQGVIESDPDYVGAP